MICESTDDAIALAADYLRRGVPVAFVAGRRELTVAITQRVAAMIPGAEYGPGQVIIGGKVVLVLRHPFMPGSGLRAWVGAVVVAPSIRRDLYGQGEGMLAKLIEDCHRAAGIQA